MSGVAVDVSACDPRTDTIPDYTAVRDDETGELAWLFVGQHRPCVEPVECNAPGSEVLS